MITIPSPAHPSIAFRAGRSHFSHKRSEGPVKYFKCRSWVTAHSEKPVTIGRKMQ